MHDDKITWGTLLLELAESVDARSLFIVSQDRSHPLYTDHSFSFDLLFKEAIRVRHMRAIQLLITSCMITDMDNALKNYCASVGNENPELARRLVMNGANPRTPDYNAFTITCHYGSYDLLKAIINEEGDITSSHPHYDEIITLALENDNDLILDKMYWNTPRGMARRECNDRYTTLGFLGGVIITLFCVIGLSGYIEKLFDPVSFYLTMLMSASVIIVVFDRMSKRSSTRAL